MYRGIGRSLAGVRQLCAARVGNADNLTKARRVRGAVMSVEANKYIRGGGKMNASVARLFSRNSESENEMAKNFGIHLSIKLKGANYHYLVLRQDQERDGSDSRYLTKP